MEDNPIKISIVIPARNEENYIGRCLDAVMTDVGDRKDIEVIVVDSNSTDRTAEVAGRYGRVKLIRETRAGANRARQTGVDASRGELIAIPDADTEMPKGWIAKATSLLEADPELICVSGPFIYYDLPRWTLIMVRFFYIMGLGLQSLSRLLIGKSNIVQGGNYMVRRDALIKAGGMNTDLVFYGDDTDLAMRLGKVGKVNFTFKMPIYVSGRRLAQEGAFTMGLKYALNNWWVTIFHRPFTLTYKEVRPRGTDAGKDADGGAGRSVGASGHSVAYHPESRLREFLVATGMLIFFLALIAVIILIIYFAVRLTVGAWT